MKQYYINSFLLDHNFYTNDNKIFWRDNNNKHTTKIKALKDFNKTKLNNKKLWTLNNYRYVITLLFVVYGNHYKIPLKYKCYDLKKKQYINDFKITNIKINHNEKL